MNDLAFEYRPSWSYNIHKSLEEFPLEKPKPSVVLRAEDVASSGKFRLPFEIGSRAWLTPVLRSYCNPCV